MYAYIHMCLLYRRLRGQLLHPRERRDLTVEAAKEGGDAESADRPQNSPCSSHNSEDIDSAESADSRTQVCDLAPVCVNEEAYLLCDFQCGLIFNPLMCQALLTLN